MPPSPSIPPPLPQLLPLWTNKSPPNSILASIFTEHGIDELVLDEVLGEAEAAAPAPVAQPTQRPSNIFGEQRADALAFSLGVLAGLCVRGEAVRQRGGVGRSQLGQDAALLRRWACALERSPGAAASHIHPQLPLSLSLSLAEAMIRCDWEAVRRRANRLGPADSPVAATLSLLLATLAASLARTPTPSDTTLLPSDHPGLPQHNAASLSLVFLARLSDLDPLAEAERPPGDRAAELWRTLAAPATRVLRIPTIPPNDQDDRGRSRSKGFTSKRVRYFGPAARVRLASRGTDAALPPLLAPARFASLLDGCGASVDEAATLLLLYSRACWLAGEEETGPVTEVLATVLVSQCRKSVKRAVQVHSLLTR